MLDGDSDCRAERVGGAGGAGKLDKGGGLREDDRGKGYPSRGAAHEVLESDEKVACVVAKGLSSALEGDRARLAALVHGADVGEESRQAVRWQAGAHLRE